MATTSKFAPRVCLKACEDSKFAPIVYLKACEDSKFVPAVCLKGCEESNYFVNIVVNTKKCFPFFEA